MDEASALLLAAALQDVEKPPWFGCFTTRDPARVSAAASASRPTSSNCSRSTRALAEHLAAELTDAAQHPAQRTRRAVRRAKGNPLFLLELAHARLELGSLDAIPGSLEDLIAARIDRLSPADRSLLRHAAVLGDRFAPRLFERTLGDGVPPPGAVGAPRRLHRRRPG